MHLKPIAVLNMAKEQVLSGWTMLPVWELRQELKIVTIVGGGLTTVVMERIRLSAVFLVRNLYIVELAYRNTINSMHLAYIYIYKAKLENNIIHYNLQL